MSVQFKNVGTENTAGIMLKDVLKLDKPTGKTKGNNGADEIWVYENGTWAKYYFWASRGAGNVWLDYSQAPTKAADAIAAETKATLKPGQCFFFIRGGSSVGVVSLSGEVIPLKDIVKFSVAGNSTTAMAFPWPTEMAINDFTRFIDKPVGKRKPITVPMKFGFMRTALGRSTIFGRAVARVTSGSTIARHRPRLRMQSPRLQRLNSFRVRHFSLFAAVLRLAKFHSVRFLTNQFTRCPAWGRTPM